MHLPRCIALPALIAASSRLRAMLRSLQFYIKCCNIKIYNNMKPTNWLGQKKFCATKIQPKAVAGGIFGRFFSNFDNCRLQAAGDVISDVAVE